MKNIQKLWTTKNTYFLALDNIIRVFIAKIQKYGKF